MNITEYKQALEAHDWTHAMSDDQRVYLKGSRREAELFAVAKSGATDFKQAYNEAYAQRFHRDPFAKPYRTPFLIP